MSEPLGPTAPADAGLRSQIRRHLDDIHDPCSVAGGTPMGLDEMGLVAGIDVSAEGDVRIDLCFTSPFCHMIVFMQEEATRRVGALDGVRSVRVVGDQGLDWSPSMIAPPAQERRRLRLEAIALRGTHTVGRAGGP